MKVYHRPRIRFVGLGTMEVVVNRQKMPRRKLISPLNNYRAVFSGFDCQTGGSATKSPQFSWFQVAMDLSFYLAHREAVVRNGSPRIHWTCSITRRSRSRRDWQWINKRLE